LVRVYWKVDRAAELSGVLIILARGFFFIDEVSQVYRLAFDTTLRRPLTNSLDEKQIKFIAENVIVWIDRLMKSE